MNDVEVSPLQRENRQRDGLTSRECSSGEAVTEEHRSSKSDIRSLLDLAGQAAEKNKRAKAERQLWEDAMASLTDVARFTGRGRRRPGERGLRHILLGPLEDGGREFFRRWLCDWQHAASRVVRVDGLVDMIETHEPDNHIHLIVRELFVSVLRDGGSGRMIEEAVIELVELRRRVAFESAKVNGYFVGLLQYLLSKKSAVAGDEEERRISSVDHLRRLLAGRLEGAQYSRAAAAFDSLVARDEEWVIYGEIPRLAGIPKTTVQKWIVRVRDPQNVRDERPIQIHRDFLLEKVATMWVPSVRPRP